MQRNKWENIAGIILFLVSAGLLGVSFFLCFSTDIWYDELFTMGLGNQPLGDLISITARDVHPPFYYMIIKFALFMSDITTGSINQVVIAKLVSVLPFFLCLIYAATLIRKNFGLLTAGLFSFLLVTMPNLADYTVEIRMYGFALFFVTAAMLHAYELVKAQLNDETKVTRFNKCYVNIVMLTIYALAACYTHYFACVAACMVYLYLLIMLLVRKEWRNVGKPFVVSTVVCIVGYLPWLLTVVTMQVEKVSENYWIQPLSIRTLGGCVKFLLKPLFTSEMVNIIVAALLFGSFGLLFVLYARKVFIKKEETGAAFGFITGCIGALAGLVAFGFLASFLIRPIFVYRYMLPAVGVFWLAMSILVMQLKPRTILLYLFMLLLVITGLRNYRAFYGEEMWKRVNMQLANEAIAAIPEEAVLICNFNQTQAVTSYYVPNESYLWYGEPEQLIQEMFPNNHALVESEFTDEVGINQITALLMSGKQVYFLGSGNAREELIGKWKAEMISATEEADILLERYWMKIFRLFAE